VKAQSLGQRCRVIFGGRDGRALLHPGVGGRYSRYFRYTAGETGGICSGNSGFSGQGRRAPHFRTRPDWTCHAFVPVTCSFNRPFVHRPRSFSSRGLSVCGAGCRSR
jgi:hypothetical protein